MSSFKSERELNTRFCANSPNAQYQINEDGSLVPTTSVG